MTPPIITALYAGLCALFFLYLTWTVIGYRRSKKISLGDGGDKDVAKAIRGQANAAEAIPLALILLGLTEMLGAPAYAVHLLGAGFLIGRLLHGLHFTGVLGFQFRPIGMLLSLITTALMALGLIGHALGGMV